LPVSGSHFQFHNCANYCPYPGYQAWNQLSPTPQFGIELAPVLPEVRNQLSSWERDLP